MKGIIRIPTHQFAFIEVEVSPEDVGGVFTEELVKIHADLTGMVKVGVGLNDKDFAPIRGRAFRNELKVEDYELLKEKGTDVQNQIISHIDKESRKDD